MVRTARRSLHILSLALLVVTAHAYAHQTDPADLAQARRLVGQSRQIISDAHRRDPRGFGGHEAKAAQLLRLAALQLNEAHDFRMYNPDKSSRPGHRATARCAGCRLASKGPQPRTAG
jgi:hypothetical protein